jgi:hypothetical protein
VTFAELSKIDTAPKYRLGYLAGARSCATGPWRKEPPGEDVPRREGALHESGRDITLRSVDAILVNWQPGDRWCRFNREEG